MTLIGLMADESSGLLVGLMGILKSGHAFVPIDPAYPAERVEFILNECGVEILITERKYQANARQFCEHCTSLQHIICLDELDDDLPLPRERSDVLPQSPAYVIYTSGSTGKPKGVPITHENLFPLLMWSRDYFGFDEHTRVLQNLSYCFDFGVFELLTTILFGGTICFPPKFSEHREWGYAEFVKEHGINTIHTTPTAFREIIAPGGTLESLEVLHLGGEQLTKNSMDEIAGRVGEQCVLFNGYGPTEATINCAIFKLGAVSDLDGQEQINIPIGSASAANTLYVLDRHLQLVPFDVAGELYVGGAGLASGYLNRPGITADRFIPNPFSDDSGARLYRTGDLVRRLADGNLEFLGRVDHQVKISGYRIELGEIETALHVHPSVRECAVLALADYRGEKRLVAYVSFWPEQEINGRELRAFLKQSLPEYMAPSVYISLPALPMTSNGKLDRRALPPPETAVEADEAYVAPTTPTEEVVANICAEVLGLKRLGRHENLFDVGCHSLLATKIVSRLRAAFQSELSLLHVFKTPTVAGLARAVETNQSSEHYLDAPPLRPFEGDGQAPLSFTQERLWFLSQLDPTSTSYSVPRALRIKGKLDVKALEETFCEIIRRHEILRTTFPTVDGTAVQMIHPPQPVAIAVLDFSGLAEAEQEDQLHRVILEEGARPFDLERGPLLRLKLVRCGPEHHVLLLTEQHLIHDGWTQGVLIRELLSIYTAFSAAQRSPLPELPIQYADFTLWQRQWLQGEVMDQLLSYWKKQLADAAPFLSLPADR
ncbi:MAG TPA: amino acid adenylation domain-containing protein, partial [Pyrinomonadaceae bacterium]|nr:amino acid adenylation domain-containing protein [Pyrinomonadaceae bacterium]